MTTLQTARDALQRIALFNNFEPAGPAARTARDALASMEANDAQVAMLEAAIKPDPTEELAMMIRMLVSSLKRHWPHAPQPDDLPSRAVNLLRKHGLMGSPLRDDAPTVPQANYGGVLDGTDRTTSGSIGQP